MTAYVFAASLALIVGGVALVYLPAALVALGASGVALTVLYEKRKPKTAE